VIIDDRFRVVKLEGLKETTLGLAFLECKTRPDLDAKSVFDKLSPKLKQDVRNRFDHWLEGNHFDRYFHGFPNHPVYDQLWIFKWQQGRKSQHRLYGFLSKPRLNDSGFKVCILVCHGVKPGGDHHDPGKLALAESLRLDIEVLREVKKAFSR
jgi:hypothetical protein